MSGIVGAEPLDPLTTLIPPTADEAFKLPTVEEAFPPDQSFRGLDPQFTLDGDYWDNQFKENQVLTKFGVGFAQGWGTGLFKGKAGEKRGPRSSLGLQPEDEDELRRVGMFNDWEKGQNDLVKTFNEVLLRSTAIGADFAYRGASALQRGLTEAIPGLGAAIEAFPAGRFTGLPARIHPRLEQTLNDAQELGVLPREEARRAFAPSSEIPADMPESVLTMEPTDVHSLARTIAPEVFTKYDPLLEQHATLSTWLDELGEARRQDPGAVELQTRIDTALGKVKGVESRLTKSARNRIEADQAALDEFLKTDTEDMAKVRKSREEIDYQLRDMAEDVSTAYRQARDEIPAVEAEWSTAEIIPLERPAVEGIVEPVAETTAPNIVNLAQRRPTISAEINRILTEAGRPAEEARAAATIWGEYYATRAERLGMPVRQLFDEDAPNIRAGKGMQRGMFSFGPKRNTITLFENADASTFMHESAHQWLNDLVKDAARDIAPDGLKADLTTVREWLGSEGELSRAQHEKFARGFERYLLEGQAPSAKLASVFEKFKEWLSRIYQSVSRLRAPINDEIRGVYDRLLSRPREEPVITTEREGARTFDEDHVISAKETPIDEAETRAADMRYERDRVAAMLSEVVDNARREARRGPPRERLPDEQKPGGEPAGEGEGTVTANESLRTSRVNATPESPTPPAGETKVESYRHYVDQDGNFVTANIRAPEEVMEAIYTAAQEAGTLTRSVLRDVDVISLADEMGLDPKKLLSRQLGEAFSAEQIQYAKNLIKQAANEVLEAGRKAETGDVNALIEYGKAKERALMVHEQFLGVRAEAGRALRAFRDLEELGNLSPTGELFQTKLGQLRQLQTEVDKLKKVDNTRAANKLIRSTVDPTWKDYFFEAWINLGLLSSYKSYLFNLLGDVSVIGSDLIETGIAASSSELRHAVTGRERSIEFREVVTRFNALGRGSVEGLKAAAHALWDETALDPTAQQITASKYRTIPSVKVNIAGVEFNVGGAQVRLPGRALGATDQFFKTIAERQELNVLAERLAQDEGLTGDAFLHRVEHFMDDPTDAMMILVRRHGRYQTFTDELGPAMRAVQQLADRNGLVKYLFPFIRTPAKLLRYAAERTPIGLMMREPWESLKGENGAAAQDQQIGRQVFGNMTMVATGVLTYNWLMTGGGPRDRAQQETWRNAGYQPYAWRAGNTWIPYVRGDPLSNIMGLGANVAEFLRNAPEAAKQDEVDEVAWTLATNMGKLLLEKANMRGVTGLVQAVVDPQRYGENWVESALGSVVPGFSAQLARDMDPSLREVHGIIDAWQARVPYWRESLFPKLSLFGEERPSTTLGITQMSDDPVAVAMARLQLGKAPPDKKIEGVTLTDKQYHEYAKYAGRMGKQLADAIVNNPGFNSLPDGIQKKLISDAFNKGHAIAKVQIQMKSLGTTDSIVQKGVEHKLKQLQ